MNNDKTLKQWLERSQIWDKVFRFGQYFLLLFGVVVIVLAIISSKYILILNGLVLLLLSGGGKGHTPRLRTDEMHIIKPKGNEYEAQ